MVAEPASAAPPAEVAAEAMAKISGERWRRLAFGSAVLMVVMTLAPAVVLKQFVPFGITSFFRDMSLSSEWSFPWLAICDALAWPLVLTPFILVVMSLRVALRPGHRAHILIAGIAITLLSSLPLLHTVAHEVPRENQTVWGVAFSFGALIVLISGIAVFECRSRKGTAEMVFPLGVVPPVVAALTWLLLTLIFVESISSTTGGLPMTFELFLLSLGGQVVANFAFIIGWVLWHRAVRSR